MKGKGWLMINNLVVNGEKLPFKALESFLPFFEFSFGGSWRSSNNALEEELEGFRGQIFSILLLNYSS